MNTRRSGFLASDLLCHWCMEAAPDTPYRSPIKDIPGGRWVVCGPDCPDRPEGVLVLTDWKASA